MRRQRSNRRLRIHRETLRRLDARDLRQVGGGDPEGIPMVGVGGLVIVYDPMHQIAPKSGVWTGGTDVLVSCV